jgi:hypothetical protein
VLWATGSRALGKLVLNMSGNDYEAWEEYTPVENRDLASMIGHMARDVGAVRLAQAAQAKDIDVLKKGETMRWKILGTVVAVLFLPAIAGVLSAGRVIERIEQMSQQIERIGNDHEQRIRSIEHRVP